MMQENAENESGLPVPGPLVFAPWEDQPKPVQCQWWVLCDHEATHARPHLILGDVPICDRCAEKLRQIEGN